MKKKKVGEVKRPRHPKVIQVSYQKVKIVRVSPKQLEDYAREDVEMLGCYTPSEHEICIFPGQSIHEESNTLLHELLHAIYFCYGLRVTSKPTTHKAQIQEEERVVNTLTNGIVEVMQRNPKLRDYFFKVWGDHAKTR
jgi:hypothetical protein